MKRLLLLAAFLTTACSTVPPTNVHQPMTARPAPAAAPERTDGAIYSANTALSLFEMKRARNVGDILTIQINEKTAATKKGNSSASRQSSNAVSVPTILGLPGKSFQGMELSTSGNHKFEGKGESNSSDTFTGTITVTVIEVLPNGNLLVSGEKQLGINQGTEYIRFSGVVDPATIGFGNTVSSTQVADARIEYRGSGYVDEAQIMGWLARFFLTFLPF
ncbi:MAG: flagellar basal body L-ring protein FlgH [Burkholderiales bacterium]|jgi:flagellar L-ring protein precursor FlgH|nr:flagellar basal body L-ring protein FlgH [Burkholderiales bacterium]